jgi:hypothetical protein
VAGLELPFAEDRERNRRAAERTEHNDINLESMIFDSLEIHRVMFFFYRGELLANGTGKGAK